ncbi:hypothetical protein HCN44_006072 [Aphidius gifuensis]|uniref:CABIT domain-containing protein n=1 Tax=Aphidius gifuensis TaxID=684658 RepID=A0A834Y6P1_APHGI|nr:rho GTPase-activating protein gacU [Aphidius gifuensis]XP_044006794.1 rho GTPase-activating protein gacU [Aphidius gifuensis]KAF7997501.1 hypothetical protein HCN44_006072 [Aphidius gifuensis]
MAATDGQIVVAAARWADESTYLREFITKYRLPAVIKITKGQYGGFGVPTLPAPSLQSTALLVSAGRRRKIVAQAVKIKEGRRVVGVGPRLAIPDSYSGYFEILSEEGRAVRSIESVNELSRRCPDDGALVRDTIRGISCKIEDSGNIITDGTRTILSGETIITAGEITLPNRGRFLRCIDSHGDNILLSMEQRGRFSVLAREDNISGVHTAKALLSKRLPLTVRLVHGQPPRGLKSSSQFLPELRLLSTFEEEHVFALPLQRDGVAIALPLAAPIKLVKSRNDDTLRIMNEFTRLVERASRLVADVADRAHVLDGRLGDNNNNKQNRQTRSAGFLRRSLSSDSNNYHHRHHHHNNTNNNNNNNNHHHNIHRDENRVPPSYTEDYDEIDQIYDYVRGFAPLPKSVRSPYENPTVNNNNNCNNNINNSNNSNNIINQINSSPPLTPITVTITPLIDDRPEPPPIETIPTKKIQAEKRTRRAVKETPMPRVEKPPLAKLYVKNSGTQRGRPLIRQKSSSPLKETPPGFKGGSPLFNIRYKSLTNLQQAMELDGTLDSSHSGGRTSGDSGAGAKLPEKRSRRLSRPRSLTNLVWELRGGSCAVRSETPPPVITAPLPSTKCGPRLAVTVVAPRRIGTLYL